MEIEVSILLALASVALLAGFFDAIAGGGGLLTLPAFFIAGVDPLAAMATNKFQASSASVSAVWAFARKRMIQWRTGWPMAALSFAGGVTGALSISMLDKALLESIVPILLITVAGYFTFSPSLVPRIVGRGCRIWASRWQLRQSLVSTTGSLDQARVRFSWSLSPYSWVSILCRRSATANCSMHPAT